ncbi:hypothetical protein D6D23_08843 [Aureobasidium pullulans]|uniref:Uncharacterized protein n=1 Tax=Aureobasidium pullulans TaxID=5580 RepID=A0A4S8VUL6_AURPU|nr:hypothetical protein D6D23_08843 [Aureobasidium pullulans]THW54632.1 hypothetical protein D6D20_10079 [Aureobasidium pullulans]
MDDQTTKELLEIQQQLTSIVTRKRQREDEESWEHKAKELEHRLGESIKRSQSMSAVYKQLKVEHGKLQKRVEKEGAMESTLIARLRERREEVYELQEKNDELMFKLDKLEERELASKRVLPVLKTKLNEALKAITELEK